MSFDHDATTPQRPAKGIFRRLLVRRDGATAIEFAILAIPFFMITFASIETFTAFMGEQVLANATETMARKIRTGEAAGWTKDQFRTAFCQEIKILMPCSATEVATPAKLFIDVRSFTSYASIPSAVPIVDSDLDTTNFAFNPGKQKSINIVRAYYRWDIVTDLVRPMLSNVKTKNGSKQNYLMVSTAVVQNEDYP
ncbi:TadE/TadG family type IV pilus assembly protein [Shinella sp. G-2]|uniref:TadE/TadG family type IV pilus assembly protein n=1 Tax=Shinella sp. G-2 TaxID=3133141 RepID=UPI003CFFEC25